MTGEWAEVRRALERFAAQAAEVRQQLAVLRAAAEERRAQAEAEYPAAVAELAAFAHSDDAPEALRRLQERVDRGETSWYGVLSGDTDEGGLIGRELATLAELATAVRSGATAEEAADQLTRRAP